ncbi:MAG: hypothetical protein ACNA8W_21450, partial [Bradymonadaceae bacterium]
ATCADSAAWSESVCVANCTDDAQCQAIDAGMACTSGGWCQPQGWEFDEDVGVGDVEEDSTDVEEDSTDVEYLDACTSYPGCPEGTTEVASNSECPQDDVACFEPDSTTPELPYPNEPADFEVIAENDFARVMPWPSAEVGLVGRWWSHPEENPRVIYLDDEADSPSSPPHVIRTHYPDGFGSGSAPVNWGGWTDDYAQYDKVYFSQHIRLEGDSYENQNVGTKLGFFGCGRATGTASNDLFPFLLGSGIRDAFTVDFRQQNVTSRNLGQNVDSSALMTAGDWHHWEILMEVNDIASNYMDDQDRLRSNGTLKWWINGVLIMEHTDVAYRTEAHPRAIWDYKWNPTWGGIGGDRTRDDYIDVAHVYISGVPSP